MPCLCPRWIEATDPTCLALVPPGFLLGLGRCHLSSSVLSQDLRPLTRQKPLLVVSGGARRLSEECSTLLADFILMADSKPLTTLDGDPVAVEALLRDVFGLVVDEAVRKGTSASEKVGSLCFLLLPILLSGVCTRWCAP